LDLLTALSRELLYELFTLLKILLAPGEAFLQYLSTLLKDYVYQILVAGWACIVGLFAVLIGYLRKAYKKLQS